MTQALNMVQSFIVGLFNIIVAAIAATETFLLGLMTQAHIPAEVQKVVLIVAAVLLIVAALRLFGQVFGILIAIFLVLLVLHTLSSGLLGTVGVHQR
jgi:hypothetical protein